MIKYNLNGDTVGFMVLLVSLFAFSTIAQEDTTQNVVSEQKWDFEKKSHGVELYSRLSESGYLKVKATTEIAVEAELFLALLENVSIAEKWIANCEKVEIVDSPSENERVVHSFFSAPWPVRNRDMVTYSKTSFDLQTNIITIQVKDYNQHIPIVDDYVRMENVNGVWTVAANKDQSIRITYEGYGEPAGNIPVWLANRLLKSSTFDTFKNMRGILSKQQHEKNQRELIKD